MCYLQAKAIARCLKDIQIKTDQMKFNPNMFFKRPRRGELFKRTDVVNMLREAYMAGYYSAFDKKKLAPQDGFAGFLRILSGMAEGFRLRVCRAKPARTKELAGVGGYLPGN